MDINVINIGNAVYVVKFGGKGKGYKTLMSFLGQHGFIMSPEIREGMMTDKDGNVYFWNSEICEALKKTGQVRLKPSTTVWDYCDERLPLHKRLLDKFKNSNKINN